MAIDYCDMCGKKANVKKVNMDLNGNVKVCKDCEKRLRNFIN